MNFFKGCINLDMVRKRFRDLAMEHHPDRGGDTATMQQVNAAYHEKLESFNGVELENRKTKEKYNYKYSFRYEQEIADKLDEIIRLKLDNIEIELVGTWIWVTGTTKEQAKLFNRSGAKMKWTKSHGGKWYWHPNVNRTALRKSTLNGLSR
jgi:hypothetical protein